MSAITMSDVTHAVGPRDVALSLLDRYDQCSGALYDELREVCRALLRSPTQADVDSAREHARMHMSAATMAAETTELACARLVAQQSLVDAALGLMNGDEVSPAALQTLLEEADAYRNRRPS